MARFAAALYRMGINRCVNVPRQISEALGASSRPGRLREKS
jgi:hypothetical protein